jgi:AcrR family transcriptional regulator
MSIPTDRRTRKRLALRQLISDTATCLFLERGFDAVTVDDIAEAADVGRMTVFNHFPRKEDMFFDLDGELRDDIRDALQQRDGDTTPVEALRLLAHRIVREQKPYIRFMPESTRFIDTIQASETLKARARAIRDELAGFVATAWADVSGSETQAQVQLAANLSVTVWAVAFLEAHRLYREHGDAGRAGKAFLAVVDQGMKGVAAALSGSATR